MATKKDLEKRRNYIIAKITKIAGSENLKQYMTVMLFEVECGFEGSVYDLIMDVHYSLRPSSRKTSKVAEAMARLEEITGIEKLSYAEIKFGKK